MANYKRKRPRTSGSGYYSRNGLKNRLDDAGVPEGDRKKWFKHWPRHWDKAMHTRPARSRNKAMEHDVIKGKDPDDMVWSDNRKPHVYYW